MSAAALTYDPLHNPERDGQDSVPSVDLARGAARRTLTRHESANIHDHTAMVKAATGLDMVLRDLLAALDKEGRA